MNTVQSPNIHYKSYYRCAFTTPLKIAAYESKMQQRVKKVVNWGKFSHSSAFSKVKTFTINHKKSAGSTQQSQHMKADATLTEKQLSNLF